jgi:hypothetical protein
MSATAVSLIQIPVKKIFPEGKAQPRDLDSNPTTTAIEQQIWSLLCDHRNSDNIAYPGIRELARRSRKGVRTVQRALRGLEEKGWIGRPEGPGGGDPNKKDSYTIYHLHRNGKLCPACHATQEKRTRNQQRAVSSVTPVAPLFAPVGAVSNQAESGVKTCSAYKEEALKQPLTQTTACEPERVPKAASATAVVADPSQSTKTPPVGKAQTRKHTPNANAWAKRLEEPEAAYWFTQLDSLVKNELDNEGKVEILQLAQQHGFSLRLLHWAFQRYAGWRNEAGGLRLFARDWPLVIANKSMPTCLRCCDEGSLNGVQSSSDNPGYCDCPPGQAMAQNAFKQQEELKALCQHCGGSGELNDREYCDCETGRLLRLVRENPNMARQFAYVDSRQEWVFGSNHYRPLQSLPETETEPTADVEPEPLSEHSTQTLTDEDELHRLQLQALKSRFRCEIS